MTIDVWLTPHEGEDQILRDRRVVVIDVLRASTTMIAALAQGAREVIPTTTVESAMKIAGNLDQGVVVLGGERHGRVIDGFHLGNSPREYTAEKVRGKTIVFSTTNGSQAIVRARMARELIIGGFVNLSVVAAALVEDTADVVILCAGRNGAFSLEDTVCAGALTAAVSAGAGTDIRLIDAAQAALLLHRLFDGVVPSMLEGTDHGRYLREIGMGDDLPVCAAADTIPVLPRLDGTAVRLPRDARSRSNNPA